MIRALSIFLTIVSICMPSHAACTIDGKSTESVELSIQGNAIDRWDTVHGKIHRVSLPSGFTVGVQIDVTSKEKYRELLNELPAVDELVKITLFNMNAAEPVRISETWGGVNSRQGLNAQGAGSAIIASSDQFQLWLHKPVCVTLKDWSGRIR